MIDFTLWIKNLRRPRLLVRAAKLGQSDYDREKVLKRITRGQSEVRIDAALDVLIPVEESLEEARRAGDASYVPSRHVEVLIAILAEFDAIRRGPARVS